MDELWIDVLFWVTVVVFMPMAVLVWSVFGWKVKR